MQANVLDSNLPLAKLGLAQIDLLRFENTNAITLLESTLQDVPGWMDALKVCCMWGVGTCVCSLQKAACLLSRVWLGSADLLLHDPSHQ